MEYAKVIQLRYRVVYLDLVSVGADDRPMEIARFCESHDAMAYGENCATNDGGSVCVVEFLDEHGRWKPVDVFLDENYIDEMNEPSVRKLFPENVLKAFPSVIKGGTQ